MAVRVLNIINRSKVMIPVELEDGSAVFLNPGQSLGAVSVMNSFQISQIPGASISFDPTDAGAPRQRLYD